MKKISVVRFIHAPLLGMEMAPVTSLTSGESKLDGCYVTLSKYDDLFLEVKFQKSQPYSQLVPWHQVGACFFEGETAVASKATNKPKNKLTTSAGEITFE